MLEDFSSYIKNYQEIHKEKDLDHYYIVTRLAFIINFTEPTNPTFIIANRDPSFLSDKFSTFSGPNGKTISGSEYNKPTFDEFNYMLEELARK